jgi:trans-2-enoyl-CoA reductase
MKGTEIIFEIMENRFRHFGILEAYTITRDESLYMNVRMDTDVKINIGLAGSHINKELHKLVEEMQKQMKGDE